MEAGNGIYANTDIPLWTPTVISDIRRLPQREKVYKVLASHPQIPVDELPLTMPEDTYCTVAEHKLLQVMSRSATKWNGIRRMLDAFGIGRIRVIETAPEDGQVLLAEVRKA